MSAVREPMDRVRGAAGSLRRRAAAAIVMSSAAVAAAVFLLATALPDGVFAGRGSLLPLGGFLSLLGVAAGAAYAVRRAWRHLRLSALAREVDEAAGMGDGDFLGAVEVQAAPGISESLARLHRDRVAERLSAVDGREYFPESAGRWRRRWRVGMTGAVVAAALLALSAATRPVPTRATAAVLVAPWRTAFPPPLPPVLVEPGDTAVIRGANLTVRAVAPERDRVTLVWQVEGERPGRQELQVGRGGLAVGRTAAIAALTRYWVEDPEGSVSDTFQVRPVEPLLIEDLQVTLSYPAYLERPPEQLHRPIPPLVLPEGTEVRLSGVANYPLTSARLRRLPVEQAQGRTPIAAGGVAPIAQTTALEVSGAAFRLRLQPRVSGVWIWELSAAGAPAEPILPDPLEIMVLPDSLPAVQILFPARDTVAGPELVLPLVIDVQDDIGLSGAELITWRSHLAGEAGPPERTPIGQDLRGRPRDILRPYIDLRQSELLPGDTAFYSAAVWDQNPAHGRVSSDTFRIRLPTLPELREAAADRTGELAADAREVAAVAAALERAAREAELRASTSQDEAVPEAGEGGEASSVEFEATEEARAALQEAEELERRLEEQADRIRALEEGLSSSDLVDPGLQEDLERLGDRYDELRQEELAERLQALEDALETLDREALEEALRGMSEGAEQIRENLDQNTDLMDRVALEQSLKASRSIAEDLASRQEAAAETRSDAPEWADTESQLAEDSEALAERLESLEAQLADAGANAAADSTGAAGDAASEAAEQMRAAADPATDAAEAGRAAGEAADALGEAASTLAAAEQEMARESGETSSAAIARARAEALDLAHLQDDLMERLGGPEALAAEDWQSRQIAIRLGLDNLQRTLSESGAHSGGLDPQVGLTIAEIAGRMNALLERLAESGGRRRPSAGEGGVITEGLNDLALRLMASEQEMQSSEESGEGSSAVEQMAALAQQQQGVTERTAGLVREGEKGQDTEEAMRRLAELQAEIGRGLEEIPEEPDLLGEPQELAQEAEAISEEMATGVVRPETRERQRRLFRRMLDAGRSLEQEELDTERRESRTGRQMVQEIPGLDPEILSGPKYPHPSDALLQTLPPFYRRLVLEYFDRLNEAAAAEGSPPEAAADRRPTGEAPGDG